MLLDLYAKYDQESLSSQEPEALVAIRDLILGEL